MWYIHLFSWCNKYRIDDVVIIPLCIVVVYTKMVPVRKKILAGRTLEGRNSCCVCVCAAAGIPPAEEEEGYEEQVSSVLVSETVESV